MIVEKLLCLVVLIITITVLCYINVVQPEPYMDEIFHFPQAVKFYNGVYTEWDPKITTPPGLYVATIIPLKLVSDVLKIDFCVIKFFRSINCVFTFGNFCLLYKLLQFFNPKNKDLQILSALTVSVFPVMYFFSFLYYTDCGSMFFILLMFLMHYKCNHWASTVSGVVSLMFRQTNIVWIFYVAAEKSLSSLLILYKNWRTKECHKDTSTMSKYYTFAISNSKKILLEIILANFGYIIIATSFFIFVFFNGSIALGDKTAHEVSFNAPQILYFLLHTLCFLSPYLVSFSKVKKFIIFVMRKKLLVLTFIIACSYCITYNTHVHPYLLADNRHITFYVWRRILGRNIYMQHALIPIYLYASWSIFSELSHIAPVSLFLLIFCIFLGTVPQKLLDFRYFIIPYVMIRTQLRTNYKYQVYCEFLLYTCINGVILHLFLNKPFLWENSQETQRFMW